jgi:3',5'-cyclic AMP phosphodiesterase CpdA
MKIAHISDLHLLALEHVPFHRFLNKRLSGWVNLKLHRGAVHRPGHARAIVAEIARREVDHVIVTGDFTNLALEGEFALARDLLANDLGFDPSRVTVVPGNHDLYTRGARQSRRFERYFAPWLQSDLPELCVDVAGVRFPVVKLRGEAAIVAVTSAVPRPPFVAAGEVGRPQMRAIERVLAHPEVARRTLVLALHHPVVDDWSIFKRHIEGLRDAPELLALLRPVGKGLIVHGHLHRRIQRPFGTGSMKQVGAGSASLHHEGGDRMAGFNVYGVASDGSVSVEAHVYRPSTNSFDVERVPDV